MKTAPRDFDIVRALAATPELRAAAKEDDGLGLLNGHFSVFDTWYRVQSAWEGDFMERVAPGAFEQTITEDRDAMKVLFDHGYDPQVGNKVLGPIRTLQEDKTGPYYEVPLLDTSYNRDLLPGLKAGVYGASFRFRVTGEEWNDEPGVSGHNPKGLPERTITATRTMEFGPVTFPASPDATAGVRSLTDQFYDRLRKRDVTAFASAARAAGMDMTGMGAGMGGMDPGATGGETDAEDGDDTPEGLAGAIDATLDAAMTAYADGNTEQMYALVVAAAATADALLSALGVPDADEMNSAQQPHTTARTSDPTGQLTVTLDGKTFATLATAEINVNKARRERADAQAKVAAAEAALATIDPTGQPDARSAGDGDGKPGNGTPTPAAPATPNPKAAARDRDLRMKGIIR